METKVFQKYYQSTAHFRLENPHPAWKTKRGWKWDRQDCVVRALANALSVEWVDAYDYLVKKGRRDLYVPNDSGAWRKWIIEDGGTWAACKAERGKKRMTALGFAETHPTGRFVLYVASHFTACVDGVILDVWNCGDKAVVGYFDMSGFSLS